MRRLGPIYDVHPGLRVQDVDAGCGACSKRLCEIIHDASNTWREGDLYCLDCGTRAPVYAEDERPAWRLRTSWRAPGKHVAACQLCPYVSMPSSLAKAAEWAEQHLAAAHSGTAA